MRDLVEGASAAEMEMGAPAAADEYPIVVEELSKSYGTRAGVVEAARDVSFKVPRGKFVSMVGPSGCGKSTVLKIVAGLVPYDRGSVTVDGRPPEPGRPDCGIMFQSAVLLPWRTVLDNVLLPIETFGMDRDAGRVRAHELLETVGLAEFAKRYPWELSGGMQQRVSLARLLVFEPQILLLDEPFAALDEFTRERLNFELARLQEGWRRSVLYVTHNILESVILSDLVVVMKPRPGEVVDIVAVDLPRPRTPEMLDAPRTTELVGQIRQTLRSAAEL
jgi:NitT/TauT family transport system ATP-binding protein